MAVDNSFVSDNEVRATMQKLLADYQQNDWAGYDPYDALHSRLQ